MDQINQYVQQCRQQGIGDEQIRQSLLTSGWNPQQVEAALGETNAGLPQPQQVPYPNQASASPVLSNTNPQTVNPAQQAAPKLNRRLILIVVSVIMVFFVICIIIALVSHKSTGNTSKAKAATSNQGAYNTTENKPVTSADKAL